jgi:NTP pyrophosphatase (non-canonical NTP hydrolase)
MNLEQWTDKVKKGTTIEMVRDILHDWDVERCKTGQSINDLIYNAFQTAKKHGFWDDLDVDNSTVLLSKLMLIATEVAEAAEAVRINSMSKLSEELADIVIRVLDLAGALGINLEQAVLHKMEVNTTRPQKHGKLA